jgi:hypothetical protein
VGDQISFCKEKSLGSYDQWFVKFFPAAFPTFGGQDWRQKTSLERGFVFFERLGLRPSRSKKTKPRSL